MLELENGVTIAFLSGIDIAGYAKKDSKIKNYLDTYTDNHFVQDDIDNLVANCKDKQINILLTCAIPRRLEEGERYNLIMSQ